MKAALFGSDGLRDNTGPLEGTTNELCGQQDITRALLRKENGGRTSRNTFLKDHTSTKMTAA
jgi:hypothetical protein